MEGLLYEALNNPNGYTSDDGRGPKLGAHDIERTPICSKFYATAQKIRIAKLILSKPSYAFARQQYRSIFGDIDGQSNSQIYKYIATIVLPNDYVVDQFKKAISTITNLEDYILARLDTPNKINASLSISIPSIILPNNMVVNTIDDPSVIELITNKIVDYVNQLVVNSSEYNSINKKIEPIQKLMSKNEFDQDEFAPTIGAAANADRIIEKIKEMARHESKIIKYISDVEVYQMNAVGILHKIYSKCKDIIDFMADDINNMYQGANEMLL